MNLAALTKRAMEIRDAYDELNRQNGHKVWGLSERAQGLVGDVGDLVKLIMAKENYRGIEGDLDSKLEHELADCLWSIITIAHKLDIDLESAFLQTMNELEERIQKN